MNNRPSSFTPQSYSPQQWASRLRFVEMVNQACRSQGIEVEWFSDLWVARMTRSGQVRYIVGYLFPFSDAAAVSLAKDKVATFQVLSSQGIPAVPHWPIPFTTRVDIKDLAGTALSFTKFPLVIKPCPGGRGRDVFKVTTRRELEDKLELFASRYNLAAICPFLQIDDEFRIVMLQHKPKLIFKKLRRSREWRHNLSLGATAAPVNNPNLEHELTALARRVMSCLGLSFGAVDVVRVGPTLQLLEVNPGFGMDHISGQPDFLPDVQDCYSTVVQLAFERAFRP